LTPEGHIKTDCLRYLNKRHIKAWNNPTGCVKIAPDRWLHFGLKGSSDILGCLPGGRFLAVETKSLRGHLTDEQREFLQEIEHLGGLAVVVHSFRELDAALRHEGYGDLGPLFEGDTTA
jgi:hypothetical protein